MLIHLFLDSDGSMKVPVGNLNIHSHFFKTSVIRKQKSEEKTEERRENTSAKCGFLSLFGLGLCTVVTVLNYYGIKYCSRSLGGISTHCGKNRLYCLKLGF